MKEVIEKLERILALTETHGICVNGTGRFAKDESELEHVESKIRLNAIQALSVFDGVHIDSNEKPRTKVEYVKVEYSKPWEIVKLYDDGVELFKTASDEYWMERINSIALRAKSGYDFYRRIETQMTEREAFTDIASEICNDMGFSTGEVDCIARALFDSGEFKLVN